MAHIHELYDLTTSAFILHPTLPQILLLKHNKLNSWLQPGGHVELNEDPLEALERELQEETGLTPDQYEILEPAEHPRPVGGNNTALPLPFYLNVHTVSTDKNHRHIDICYLVQAKTAKLTSTPDGASDIKWLSRSQIGQLHDANEMFPDTFQICEWVFSRRF